VNRDLTNLNTGERLLLWRRRYPTARATTLGRSGARMSRAEAAVELGLSVKRYAKIEDDSGWLDAGLTGEEAARVRKKIADIVSPTIAEMCYLARRRSGLPLAKVEAALGTTRPTLHKMEREGNPRLVAFWEGRGFLFKNVIMDV
jgi:DNA-binding XRE family transcriptional regulator